MVKKAKGALRVRIERISENKIKKDPRLHSWKGKRATLIEIAENICKYCIISDRDKTRSKTILVSSLRFLNIK